MGSRHRDAAFKWKELKINADPFNVCVVDLVSMGFENLIQQGVPGWSPNGNGPWPLIRASPF